jgi:hypothetical protein
MTPAALAARLQAAVGVLALLAVGGFAALRHWGFLLPTNYESPWLARDEADDHAWVRLAGPIVFTSSGACPPGDART